MPAIGKAAAHEAGQTLIEMLVALAIMMLVVGIAAPMIGRVSSRQPMLEAQATLAIEVAEAHADAVAHGAPVRLAFVPDGNRLTSSAGRPDHLLPTGAVVDWPSDGVVFYGDGTASAWDGAIHVAATTRRFHLDATRSRLDFGT